MIYKLGMFLAFVVWPVAVGYSVYRWVKDPWTQNMIRP